MASSAPLSYCYSPQFLGLFNAISTNNNLSSSPSNSCSPSPYSSYPNNWHRRRVHSRNLAAFSGLKNILMNQNHRAQAMSTSQGNVTSNLASNHASPKDIVNREDRPDHLLVLVHGILASPSDWTYFNVELKRRLGKKFVIYASSCNMYTKTFTGIEGAGKRLADEVIQVVDKTEGLKKISFLAHSLGGLFSRYAIAVLYTPNGSYQSDDVAGSPLGSSNKGLIAGLEAINFITLATPHLGVRGNKQLPFLLGVPFLEKLAAPLAPIFTGRTGTQLFLTDGKPTKPPLLLRMASDCEEGKFISALSAFRCRVLYANVSYDHMVGWRTSSIRRENQLIKPPRRSLDGYKHVVDVEYCPPVLSEAPHFPPEAAKAKEAAKNEPSVQNTVEYHEIMEEEMIHGLQRLGWRKVDVSFHSAFWPFFAHNNIHVKNEWFHNAGAGVVAHVTDTIKQQEMQQKSPSTFIAANL
ncbi:Hydrolase-like protein family [Perilla frutescens var. hirtella]|nr:Hydrolase-like protein family [Perilla frutescens var. frutescens]KAH6776790.1 Hydrolase-like protein family [Perilla frutescens var. hirtella]